MVPIPQFVVAHIFLMRCMYSVAECSLHGTDSGLCTFMYLPETYGGGVKGIESAEKQWKIGTDGPCKNGTADHCMPFCGRWIANYYAPCVPSPMEMPTDHTFSDDGLIKHTVREKDRWIEKKVKSIITSRKTKKTNATATNSEVDEYGTKEKSISTHFDNNKDCQLAYERYFCWLNFPRCDNLGETLPMCQSTCENLFRVCKYDPALYPCAIESNKNGDVDKGYFPGEPFKLNEFMPDSKGEPKAVCTPSIKGTATKNHKRKKNALVGAIISSMTILILA